MQKGSVHEIFADGLLSAWVLGEVKYALHTMMMLPGGYVLDMKLRLFVHLSALVGPYIDSMITRLILKPVQLISFSILPLLSPSKSFILDIMITYFLPEHLTRQDTR